MKKVKITILLLLLSTLTNAQLPPDTAWTMKYGGNDQEEAYAVEPTMDGGFIIATNTKSFGSGLWDAWLIKTDAQGNQEWAETYGGTGIDNAYDVKQTTDGGYIVAGRTDQDGSSFSKVWLIKTNAMGDMMWDITFGENDRAELANSIQLTYDSCFIIAGMKEVEPYDDPHQQFWLIKTDAGGNLLWDHTFGGPDYDAAFSVRQTSDSGFLLVGTTEMPESLEDIRLVKTDRNGNPVWEKTYGGLLNDAGMDVMQTGDGGYLLTGQFQSNPTDPSDMWVIKTDADGNQIWDDVFGGLSMDVGYALLAAPESGYLLTGMTASFGAGGADGWLIKIDEVGNEEWSKTIGTSGNERFRDIALTAAKNPIVTGHAGTFTDTDAWLVKLESGVGMADTPKQENELKIFPNPAINQCNVWFSLPERSSVILKLYDAWGKMIRSVYNGDPKGEILISLSLEDLSEGTYFLCLNADDQIMVSRKIVVLKKQ
ncbi:MAG: T9SS type A sorting domain-containing protein [Bacteroidales bacterium]|nr:T9SS type A sorting domain-containing protein [Bacteroidales bacterium]